jgi:hypothetical protein
LLGLHLECMIVASHDLVQEDLLPRPHLKLECVDRVGYAAAKYKKDSTQNLLSLLCHNCWIFWGKITRPHVVIFVKDWTANDGLLHILRYYGVIDFASTTDLSLSTVISFHCSSSSQLQILSDPSNHEI